MASPSKWRSPIVGALKNPEAGKPTAITELWLRSRRRRFYAGITFDPSGNAPAGYFRNFNSILEPKVLVWSERMLSEAAYTGCPS